MENLIEKDPKTLQYFSLSLFLITVVGFVATLFFYHPSILQAHESVIFYSKDHLPVLKTTFRLPQEGAAEAFEVKVKYASLGVTHFSTLKLSAADTTDLGRSSTQFYYRVRSVSPAISTLPATCVIYSKQISGSNLLKSIIKI